MDWGTQARPSKEQVRAQVMRKRDQVFESAILLPSKEMLDLKLGFDNKIFNKNTKFLLAEWDPGIAETIHKQCKKMNLNFSIHVGDLVDAKLQNTKYDFTYLDLCGSASRKLLSWLRTYQDNMSKELHLTFNANLRRGSKEHNLLKSRLKASDYARIVQKATYINPVAIEPKKSIANGIWQTTFVYHAMDRSDMNLSAFIPYADTVPMTSISFDTIKTIGSPLNFKNLFNLD